MPGFCRWWHLARLGMLICAPGCALSTFAQEPLPWVDGSTTLVLLPDTQQYTKSRPQFFEAQARWVAAQQAPRHIAYVVHQILSDYEAMRGNGQGFLRALEFLPDVRSVRVKAYSPVLDKYLNDPQNQFSFTLKPATPPTQPSAANPTGLSAPPDGTTAERLDAGRWQRVPVRTVADVTGLPSGEVPLSQYGGLATGERLRATGFFRTERVGRNWMLVDPEGCSFLSVGLCSVNLSGFSAGAADKQFGGTTSWAEQTLRLLKECGFNTLGRWSDAATFNQLKKRMAYVTTTSFMAAYDKQRPRSNGARRFPERTIPVFDKEFPEFCDKLAQGLAAAKDDPWLLGHLSDNELPFRPDGLSCYLRLPPLDPGHQAAESWLVAHQKQAEHVTEADQLAFVATVAERYYSTVRQAILKYDPHHLYLGSRLNGRNINDGTLRGSRPLDVVSINMYHHWSNDDPQMDRWAELSQRPLLNSEWYAMSLASATVDTNGAGFRVRSQRDRGLFYQNLCLGMLGNRNCVGWHWFKYTGDAADNCRGFVDSAFEPHREMTDLMRQLNAQIYPLRAALLPK